MKFSIITPSYNQGRFIEQTITSVLRQRYEDFEHIVIDGGSNDDTIEILQSYGHLRWISEPDGGVSDALNKGLSMCSGDVVGWLNSDDFYFDEWVLHTAAKDMMLPRDWIIGGTSKLRHGELTLNPYQPISRTDVFRNCDYLRTPASFYRIEILRDVGGFDPELHQAMDYDLYIRLLRGGLEPHNNKNTFTVFRVHEDQKTHPSNLWDQYKEIMRINYRNRLYLSSLRKTAKFLVQWLLFRFKG